MNKQLLAAVLSERGRGSAPSEEELRSLTAELRRAIVEARRALEKGLQAAQEASCLTPPCGNSRKKTAG